MHNHIYFLRIWPAATQSHVLSCASPEPGKAQPPKPNRSSNRYCLQLAAEWGEYFLRSDGIGLALLSQHLQHISPKPKTKCHKGPEPKKPLSLTLNPKRSNPNLQPPETPKNRNPKTYKPFQPLNPKPLKDLDYTVSGIAGAFSSALMRDSKPNS